MKKTILALLIVTLAACSFTGCQSKDSNDGKNDSTGNLSITDDGETGPMKPIADFADNTEVDYKHITINGKLLKIEETTPVDMKKLGFDLTADMDQIVASEDYEGILYECHNGEDMSFYFSNLSENDKKLSECTLELVTIGSTFSEDNFSAYIWSIGSGLNQDSTYEDFLQILGEPYDYDEDTEKNYIRAYWKNDDWNTFNVMFDASNRKVRSLEMSL